MNISDLDHELVWHPYTPLSHEGRNITIVKAKDTHLYDDVGNKYLDAISSWWVNIHGHGNQYIADRVARQAEQLEHVIFAGFTHPPAVELADRVLNHLPENQSKIFYSDNGSTAVEVALKMAFQYWYNKGRKKTKVIAFKQAYHGDTFGAMSVGARSAFTAPFTPFLFDVEYIECPIPGQEERALNQLKKILESNDVAAFIFEPLVLGTAGMQMYKPEVLDEMLRLCISSSVLTIADEVMTGFGRTGTFFAMDQVKTKPDMICLSKGITGGTMAMGVTSCTQEIYVAFWGDVAREGERAQFKTFFHGHSYTANPISCAAALASLDLLEKEECITNIRRIGEKHKEFAEKLKGKPGIKEVRCKGTIIAIEFDTGKSGYFSDLRAQLYGYFLDRGILLRPLGNVIYILPPYCITDEELDYVYTAIREFKL